MASLKKTKGKGPEEIILQRIVKMLRYEGWFVLRTHGNEFQQGVPDLIATHSRYGLRLIEVKNPKSYKFTGAQLEVFPKLVANGTGVWILVNDTPEEYNKLFKGCNWYQYLSVMK